MYKTVNLSEIERELLKLERLIDIERKMIVNKKHFSLCSITDKIKENCIKKIEKEIVKKIDYDTKIKIKKIFERIIEKNRENIILFNDYKKEIYTNICKLNKTKSFF